MNTVKKKMCGTTAKDVIYQCIDFIQKQGEQIVKCEEQIIKYDEKLVKYEEQLAKHDLLAIERDLLFHKTIDEKNNIIIPLVNNCNELITKQNNGCRNANTYSKRNVVCQLGDAPVMKRGANKLLILRDSVGCCLTELIDGFVVDVASIVEDLHIHHLSETVVKTLFRINLSVDTDIRPLRMFDGDKNIYIYVEKEWKILCVTTFKPFAKLLETRLFNAFREWYKSVEFDEKYMVIAQKCMKNVETDPKMDIMLKAFNGLMTR